MNWLWLNIPLGSLIFLAVAGIPMWLVLKHPDARQHIQGAALPSRRPARAHVARTSERLKLTGSSS
jgi:hypothetical protein